MSDKPENLIDLSDLGGKQAPPPPKKQENASPIDLSDLGGIRLEKPEESLFA